MENYTYIKLRERPELKQTAADWFHNKWGVPTKAYLDCMDAYLREIQNTVGTFDWMMTKLLAEWALSKTTYMTVKTLHPMSAQYIQKKATAVKESQVTCSTWLSKI